MEQTGVVVVAAGKGSRMGANISKQYLTLAGKPILIHTLQALEAVQLVHSIVLVIGEEDQQRCNGYIQAYGLQKISAVVTGGAERQASVYRGLQALDPELQWVLVHDGVRPFITAADAHKCLAAAQQDGAAVLGVPVKDTIKVVKPDGRIESTPERSSLWAIQTPQAFRISELVAAHELAFLEGYTGTDDAALVERAGQPVRVVEGNRDNIKITTPEDLEWAELRMIKVKGEGGL